MNRQTLLLIGGGVLVALVLFVMINNNKQSSYENEDAGCGCGCSCPQPCGCWERKMRKRRQNKPLDLKLDLDMPKQKKYLVLFFMENCGGCNQMKPIWHAVKQKMNGKNGIEMVELINNGNMKIFQKHNVNSVPTIKLCYDDIANPSQVIDYKGGRTEKELEQFISNY